MKNNNILGNKIKEVRKELRLTQEQLSKRMGISRSTLRDIDTGKYKHINAGLHFRKPKNKIEELELEIMKKDIEIARLKKGYAVKGVGAKKGYVTTFEKNIK